MHETMSTCNPSLVWPLNAASVAGLRAIPRSELARSTTVIKPTASSNDAGAFKSKYARAEGKKKKLDGKYDSGGPYKKFNGSSSNNFGKRTHLTNGEPSYEDEDWKQKSLASQKRLRDAIQQDLNNARDKRAKIIVPEGKLCPLFLY